MKILVSGSSGLIGRTLVAELEKDGARISKLVRSAPTRADDVLWDPEGERFDSEAAEEVDAVVHLAGENIAAGRWTPARRQAIRNSRVLGTRLLAAGLAALRRPPKVMLCASATGFYGNTGESLVDETAPPGRGFLAETCKAWEAAAEPAREKGIRVVHLRFGVVLSTRGGALKRMLPVFRLGLGGRLGSGEQWMSWISLDDVPAIIRLALSAEDLSGPVNVVAPEVVRNRDFSRTLASALRRPALLPAPSLALRLAFGEMADETLLTNSRVAPTVLTERAHRFRYGELEAALRHLLEREP